MSEFYGEQKYFSFIRQTWDAKSLHHLHYHYLPWEVWEDSIEDMLSKQGFSRIERPEYNNS